MSKKILLVLFAFICVLVTSCTNMNSMLGDYNGSFTVKTDVQDYTVDGITNAEDMLGERYAVSYYTTLCLVAPRDGASYSWIAEVCENADEDIEEEAKKNGISYTLGLDQMLTCYLPDSEIVRWGSYKLTLTVTKINGEILKDTAWLYVY